MSSEVKSLYECKYCKPGECDCKGYTEKIIGGVVWTNNIEVGPLLNKQSLNFEVRNYAAIRGPDYFVGRCQAFRAGADYHQSAITKLEKENAVLREALEKYKSLAAYNSHTNGFTDFAAREALTAADKVRSE